MLPLSTALGQTTTFTYQGRLTDTAGIAINATYDLRFKLFDGATSPTQIGNSITNFNVPITNGLFTVSLDFGATVFPGDDRWLEIATRTNITSPFRTLSPRQQLTSAPYAIRSANAATAASVAAGAINSAALADGSVTLNKLAPEVSSQLGGSATAWQLNGNSGTAPGTQFLGTTDNQALEIKVNGSRALRVQPSPVDFIFGQYYTNTVSLIGGSAVNSVASGQVGATIGGGGQAESDFAIAAPNVVSEHYGTIGGGLGNTVAGYGGTIAGGDGNSMTEGSYATISGGAANLIGGNYSSIAGGEANHIESGANLNSYSSIGGGYANLIWLERGSIDVFGGHGFCTISGGNQNTISTNADYCTIGGGFVNSIDPNSSGSSIGGGSDNRITAGVAGGTIPGGTLNSVGADYALAAGYRAQANHQGAFVWADSQNANFASTAANQFLIRAAGGVGINEPHPDNAALDVLQVSNRVATFNRTGNDGVLVSFQRDGFNVGDITVSGAVVSYNAFTGSHYAWTKESIEYGMLVSMTGKNRRYGGQAQAEVIYGVELTRTANDSRCLGSYLGLQEPHHPANDVNPHQIMAAGNGEMWVVDAGGGDIHPGAYLISSAVAGCAMKDDPARFPIGYVIARAADVAAWSDVKAGPDGVKRAKISVLYESFERHSPAAEMAGELKQKEAQITELKQRLERLEKLFLRGQQAAAAP